MTGKGVEATRFEKAEKQKAAKAQKQRQKQRQKQLHCFGSWRSLLVLLRLEKLWSYSVHIYIYM